MDRREWSPPAVEPAQGKARESSDATGSSRSAGARWYGRFMVYMLFFGAIGALFSSSFPIKLGAFLFFTDDDFIEWVLESVGIRLVPDSLGRTFIKTFVFLIAWFIIVASWRESAPEWLSSWIPPGAPAWSVAAGAALLIAVLSTASKAIITNLLPEITSPSLTWTITRALIALALFGMLALFAYGMRPLHVG